MFEGIFHSRKLNCDKLPGYGFEAKGSRWIYRVPILDNAFILQVSVDENGAVDTELTEAGTNEPYVLYKTNASGTFVGLVRTAIEDVLQEIAEACYEISVFRSAQTLEMIRYVRDRYGDEPEYLWTKFPDNAVLRRKDSKKWYAAILTVEKSKLGLPSNAPAEIIDLRLSPEQMAQTVDGKRFFPGWHMNKKSWYTIILDHSVSTEELCRRLDESYTLAKK